jgi:hypothetical protein
MIMDFSGECTNDDWCGGGVKDTTFGCGGHQHPHPPPHDNESVFHTAAEICYAADRGDTSTMNSLLNDNQITAFMEMFQSLIGYGTNHIYDGCDIPLSVKAHLMLRAFLQFPHSSTVPW